ncbi:PREDICTED: alanine and arginine-rich domain-containing protein [Gekko japonicus]|uniref:Alanine and arginine-rich domain-containing protein n=1 Tax=Gekko japonicus TaxID=146911 RepID=A0ABM1KT35_GEKJA|nr:PREDICTED: alanine and arginine-rich domain-containing protein [Gekko japonicus]
MDVESPCEEALSSLLLEDVKQRLRKAFRGQGTASTPLAPRLAAASQERGKRTLAAQEELRRAHIEGAIAWLRVELLEMKSQNRQLAKTLLDLSTDIQRLRNETEMTPSLESKNPCIAESSE